MNLGNPVALYALLLVPVFVLLLFIFKNKRKRQLLKFCDEKLLNFHNKNFSSFYFNLRTFLLVMVYTLLVIALARPQWDREVRMVDSWGQDLVFLIDVSKSMDAQDIRPSRLERAKTHINLFLDELRGDRVAIVAFAGDALIICPLTTDYAALKLIVSSLSTETITDFGTNIGAGLRKAAEVFDQEANAKTIILLSDGEDLEEDGFQIARLLSTEGVVVYTIGIGTPEGSPIQFTNERGQIEYARDDQGNVVITRLDVLGLHRIAESTGGQFFMITPQYSEIFEVLRQIQHNERTMITTRQFFRYKEQYHYFLILGLIFLVLEGFINYRFKERTNV
ncbi:MAG: VWA domain-containing protein [Candidatus Cloacimonetes bacterium]|nr:VWA domain-containing protein [Candidatus Cloacimonadota bacterium]